MDLIAEMTKVIDRYREKCEELVEKLAICDQADEETVEQFLSVPPMTNKTIFFNLALDVIRGKVTGLDADRIEENGWGGGVKLHPGMLIKTNYSGPYRIKSIKRDCTCPSHLDQINSRNPKSRPPHLEMVVTRPDGTGEFYLGGYIEETLQSLSKSYCGKKQALDHDFITIIDQDKPVQMRLF